MQADTKQIIIKMLKKSLLSTTFILLLVPSNILASTYGAGNYGSLNYNQMSDINNSSNLSNQTEINSIESTEIIENNDSKNSAIINDNSYDKEFDTGNKTESIPNTHEAQESPSNDQNNSRIMNLVFGITAILLSLCIFLYLIFKRIRKKS